MYDLILRSNDNNLERGYLINDVTDTLSSMILPSGYEYVSIFAVLERRGHTTHTL